MYRHYSGSYVCQAEGERALLWKQNISSLQQRREVENRERIQEHREGENSLLSLP
jgi:hypothetical protein